MTDNPWELERGNQSAMRFLRTQIGFDATLPVLAVLLGLSLAAMWKGRRDPRAAPAPIDDGLRQTREEFVAVALGCTIGLLTAPVVWSHYFCLTLPAILLGLGELRADGTASTRDSRQVDRAVRIAATVLAATLLSRFRFPQIFEGSPVNDAFLRNTSATVLLLIAGLVAAMQRPARRVPTDAPIGPQDPARPAEPIRSNVSMPPEEPTAVSEGSPQ